MKLDFKALNWVNDNRNFHRVENKNLHRIGKSVWALRNTPKLAGSNSIPQRVVLNSIT